MIIAIDASRYGHKYATGVEWYSFYIINYLLKTLKDSPDFSNHKVLLYCREKVKIPESKNVKIVQIKRKKLWTLLGMSKQIFTDKPDVLFVPSHTLPLFLPKRTVIMIHDVAFKRFSNVYGRLAYMYLDWTTKFSCKFATKILVPSIATKEDLIKFYKCDPAKISVIQHGFEMPENQEKVTKPKSIKDGKYLLFVGRIENKKNLLKLVSAFKIVKNRIPDLSLVLAGKPGLGYPEILDKINVLKLADSVILPGYIDENEKAALYQNAECFVFPSLYEGFGLPVLEAFFHKCPVVCSDSSSLPEVCGDACEYIKNDLEKDMAEKIIKVITDDAHRNLLIKKGSERLKLFSWDTCAKETLDILISNK